MDKEEGLSPIFNKISYFMEDYHYSGHFWLEGDSPNTLKGKGIKSLKYLNASVSSGDSNNDISMFETSDKSYAVSNASDFVKSKSSGIIGSNNENSVAKFIINQE